MSEFGWQGSELLEGQRMRQMQMQTTIASDGVLLAAPFSASALAMAIRTYCSSDVPQQRCATAPHIRRLETRDSIAHAINTRQHHTTRLLTMVLSRERSSCSSSASPVTARILCLHEPHPQQQYQHQLHQILPQGDNNSSTKVVAAAQMAAAGCSNVTQRQQQRQKQQPRLDTTKKAGKGLPYPPALMQGQIKCGSNSCKMGSRQMPEAANILVVQVSHTTINNCLVQVNRSNERRLWTCV